MAPNLPDLPVELLLAIIEIPGCEQKQKHLVKLLRAICQEVHEKMLHHFGTRYFTKITTSPSKTGLDKLCVISGSRIAFYVKLVTMYTTTLIAPEDFNGHEWYDRNGVCKSFDTTGLWFDEATVDMDRDGTVENTLVWLPRGWRS